MLHDDVLSKKIYLGELMQTKYDVLIIGGGPAGLSAAMSLSRMNRSVLICDDDRPRNKPAQHMNNFVSQDGLNPAAWRESARKDLSKYPTVTFSKKSVSEIEQTKKGFSAFIDSKDLFFRKVILAYGVQDKLLEVPGMQELWGKSVFHCPYCHGYEVQDSKLGLIANGKFAEHLFPMIQSLSSDTILFTHGAPLIEDKLNRQINKNKLNIISTPIKALKFEQDKLQGVLLENDEFIEREGLFVAPQLPFQSKCSIGQELQCEKNEMGFYKIDHFHKTTVAGVFAAGDITTPMHSVLAAAAAGQIAGASAASELIQEDFYAF